MCARRSQRRFPLASNAPCSRWIRPLRPGEIVRVRRADYQTAAGLVGYQALGHIPLDDG